MPRYFFDLHDNGKICVDDEGSVLGDLDQAKTEAVLALAEMSRDLLREASQRELVIEVRDDEGASLAKAEIKFVLRG